MNDPIVIVATKRTPIGQFLGCFADIPAPQLAAATLKALLDETKLDTQSIDEVILGCVLSAGIGQAPARQAALFAGFPQKTCATTVNKMCGSGMKAIMLAHSLLTSGSANIIMAGGMESMTQAPYLLNKARSGYRINHAQMYDHMFLDGLEDAYDKGKLMGFFAEQCAQEYQFTRQAQDEFALQSLMRAQKAIQQQYFKNEIVALNNQMHDELPGKAKPEKIPLLKPAFKPDGTVTAANASAISDGAASHLLMRLSTANSLGLKPLAYIVAHAQHAQAPNLFTTAPIYAIQKVLEQSKWTVQDLDLIEINEAFAVVTMAAIQDLKLDPEKVNIHGGACALGHPIGASGARILTTLIYALKQYGLKRGLASLCIGGGGSNRHHCGNSGLNDAHY